MKKIPVFDYNICIACGICVQACPISAIELSNTTIDNYLKAYPMVIEQKCTGCSICMKNCPIDAIEMQNK